jgi:hypothetical protein
MFFIICVEKGEKCELMRKESEMLTREMEGLADCIVRRKQDLGVLGGP